MFHIDAANLPLVVFAAAVFAVTIPAAAGELDPGALKKLLGRLDLNHAGFEKIKQGGDPGTAAAELLAYYRARTDVKHPVDRAGKAAARKPVPKAALKTADDALDHFFMSQGSYPRYFAGKDIDWMKNPVADKEWLWQLHRMYFWDAMARAYWLTGDEKYAKEWAAQLLDWTRKNPNDEAHGAAWRTIEAGIRGYTWTGLYQHFIDSPHFTPEVLVAFLNSCCDHAEYLEPKYSKGSNWGLMESEGLAFIAMTFPEFKEADAWRKTAIGRLAVETKKQVREDGHQVEQCLNYHSGCIDWFARSFELARLNGREKEFPADYLDTIEKMAGVLMVLGFPDGSSAQFGDTSSAVGVRGPLLKWGSVFPRDDFLYAGSAGKRGAAPKDTAFALKASGFYSFRSGWDADATCLVLKCGPGGYWHCQPDNGTFELVAAGRRLMPDSGTYVYSGDDAGRAWFRQTRVHQTITLDDKDSLYDAKCLVWKPGDSLDALVVENRSYPELTHRRAMFFVGKKFFVLVDDAVGVAKGNVDLHYQLAPGEVAVDAAAPSVRTVFKDGANVLVRALAQPGMSLDKEEGQVSFHYGSKEPRPAFRFRVDKKTAGAVRFVTLIVPYRGDAPETAVRVLDAAKPGSNLIDLEVTVGKDTARITCELGKPAATEQR